MYNGREDISQGYLQETKGSNSTNTGSTKIYGRRNIQCSKGSSEAKRKEENTEGKRREGSWTIYQNIKQLESINFVPDIDNIFSMFKCLSYDSIKVVIIGQDPYPGRCNISKVSYACGPAFVIPDNALTCPVSLKNLFSELKREYTVRPIVSLQYIKLCLKYWISQGVFLTNLALTRGLEGTYLDNHKNFWMEFSISFIKKVSMLGCPIVLLGAEAWELSNYIDNDTPIYKFYHPVSRDNQFANCKMFSKINSHLSKHINWVF